MKLHNIDSILFVCLGNICRSPIAEGVARDRAKKLGLSMRLDSAGTGSWHIGNPPCPNSIKVAREFGVDISDLRARQVRESDFSEFSLIVAMDSSNLANLKSMRNAHDKIYKLGDFGKNGADVPDPYYFEEYDGFRDVYRMIESCVDELFERLVKDPMQI